MDKCSNIVCELEKCGPNSKYVCFDNWDPNDQDPQAGIKWGCYSEKPTPNQCSNYCDLSTCGNTDCKIGCNPHSNPPGLCPDLSPCPDTGCCDPPPTPAPSCTERCYPYISVCTGGKPCPETGCCDDVPKPTPGPKPKRIISDTKFACTANGCEVVDEKDINGIFRATGANVDANGNIISYYSEECESNCPFSKQIHKTFYDINSPNFIPGICVTDGDCHKVEKGSMHWVKMDRPIELDPGRIYCKPIGYNDVPNGVTAYANPLECHNAFDVAGFTCEDAGFCRLYSNPTVGSTLEGCHETCVNNAHKYSYNGKYCQFDPASNDTLHDCLQKHQTFDCSGFPYYECQINNTGTGRYTWDTLGDCYRNCKP